MGDNITVYPDSRLFFKDKEYRCALGMGGVRSDKQEGDGATPTGCFPIRMVFYRPDRLSAPPKTILKTIPTSNSDGWSDDTSLPQYNTQIKLPHNGSHEKLWRDDNLYDIIVVLGYNDNPPIAGKGSAIFMHLAREGYPPTAGCIALAMNDLLEILVSATPTTLVCVKSNQS